MACQTSFVNSNTRSRLTPSPNLSSKPKCNSNGNGVGVGHIAGGNSIPSTIRSNTTSTISSTRTTNSKNLLLNNNNSSLSSLSPSQRSASTLQNTAVAGRKVLNSQPQRAYSYDDLTKDKKEKKAEPSSKTVLLKKEKEQIQPQSSPSLLVNGNDITETKTDTGNTMAGDIRFVEQANKKPRRHWTLRDRSAMSVHFLKTNLAEDGCEEAQLDVAKKLLQDSRDTELLEDAKQENARLAVYWLVKSSEQGNADATKLLRQCLEEGHGITAQNLSDVKVCVNTPSNEKLTYKAAKLLYMKLNNGEKFITTIQLLERIQNLTHKKTVRFAFEPPEIREPQQDSSISSTFTESEDGSKDANVKLNETFTFQQPQPQPSSLEDVTEDEQSPDDHNNKTDIKLNHRSPEGEKLTLEDLLKCAASFNSGASPKPTINNEHKEKERHRWNFGSQFNAFFFQLLILGWMTEAIDKNQCVILGASLMSLWASFNLLGWARTHLNFKDWSKAFGSIHHENHVWSDAEAENRLTLKIISPYLLAISLSVVPVYLVDGFSIFKLIIGSLVIYTLLTGVIRAKLPTARLLAFCAAINFSRILSLLITSGEEIISSQDFLQEYLTSISIEIPTELRRYAIPLTQGIAIFSLLLGTRRKFMMKLLPEFLTALWITKVAETISELKDDTRTLGLTLIVGIVVILILQIVQSQLNPEKTILWLVFILALSGAGVFHLFSSLGQNPAEIIDKLFASRDLHIYNSNNVLPDIDSLPLLDWEVYDKDCHRQAWKTYTPAYTQISCFNKYGTNKPTAVKWKGRVMTVKVKDMSFQGPTAFEVFINLIPYSDGKDASSWQKYLPGSETKQQPSPATLHVPTAQLQGTSQLQKLIEFLTNLRTGDIIQFHGVLNPLTVGGLKPEIGSLKSIRCIQCSVSEEHREYFIQMEKSHFPNNAANIPDETKEDYGNSQTSVSELLQKQFLKLIDLIKSCFI